MLIWMFINVSWVIFYFERFEVGLSNNLIVWHSKSKNTINTEQHEETQKSTKALFEEDGWC